MRRLLALACAIVFVDTTFYAAITPLLPHFEDEFGLSKSAAGVLAAAYPAGTLVGAIPGGYLAARAGVRATVLLGLALMVVSSLAFAFADSIVMLDAARFLQGIGGAASWAGAMAWVASAAPRDRRGEMIGTTMGAAVAGALAGPAIGALADAVGITPTFCGVAVVGTLLALWALRTPPAEPEGTSTPRELLAALRDGRVAGRHLADRGARPAVRHDRRARAAAARRPRRRRGDDRRGLARRRRARVGGEPDRRPRVRPPRAAVPVPDRPDAPARC